MLINQLTHKTMSLLILEVTNKGLFTLSVLPWENRLIKNKKFPGLPNQITEFLQASTSWNFTFLEMGVFNYFVFQTLVPDIVYRKITAAFFRYI